MKITIALFRGINVGGRNSLPMRALVDILEDLGLKDIRTYIQSGNVIFQSKKIDSAELVQKIGEAILESHGFTPQVILLDLSELEMAARLNPFPDAEPEPKALHVFFLADLPVDPDLKTLKKIRGEHERFEHLGKLFYLHAPDGIGKSKLAAKVEKALGVPVTARNWKTVNKLLDLAKS
jgi:uncharacterized protein (DUF1697 family)